MRDDIAAIRLDPEWDPLAGEEKTKVLRSQSWDFVHVSCRASIYVGASIPSR